MAMFLPEQTIVFALVETTNITRKRLEFHKQIRYNISNPVFRILYFRYPESLANFVMHRMQTYINYASGLWILKKHSMNASA